MSSLDVVLKLFHDNVKANWERARPCFSFPDKKHLVQSGGGGDELRRATTPSQKLACGSHVISPFLQLVKLK